MTEEGKERKMLAPAPAKKAGPKPAAKPETPGQRVHELEKETTSTPETPAAKKAREADKKAARKYAPKKAAQAHKHAAPAKKDQAVSVKQTMNGMKADLDQLELNADKKVDVDAAKVKAQTKKDVSAVKRDAATFQKKVEQKAQLQSKMAALQRQDQLTIMKEKKLAQNIVSKTMHGFKPSLVELGDVDSDNVELGESKGTKK